MCRLPLNVEISTFHFLQRQGQNQRDQRVPSMPSFLDKPSKTLVCFPFVVYFGGACPLSNADPATLALKEEPRLIPSTRVGLCFLLPAACLCWLCAFLFSHLMRTHIRPSPITSRPCFSFGYVLGPPPFHVSLAYVAFLKTGPQVPPK